jgi:ATP-dependent DNA helicase RecG
MASRLPQNLDDILKLRIVESARVEFKAHWKKAEPNTGPKALQTICAFANDLYDHDGGWLILGVEEDENRQPRLPPRGLDDIDTTQKLVREALRHIQPEYSPIFYPEEVDGKQLLFSAVHPARAGPTPPLSTTRRSTATRRRPTSSEWRSWATTSGPWGCCGSWSTMT